MFAPGDIGQLPLTTKALSKIFEAKKTAPTFEKFLVSNAMQEELSKHPNQVTFDRCNFSDKGAKLFNPPGGNKLSTTFKANSPPMDALTFALSRGVFATLGLTNVAYRTRREGKELLSLIEAATASGLPIAWNPYEPGEVTGGLILDDITLGNNKLVSMMLLTCCGQTIVLHYC